MSGISKANAITYNRNMLLAILPTVATLLPFIGLAHYLGITIEWRYVLLGALGWAVAMVMRLLVIFLLGLINSHVKERTHETLVWVSGPAEELIRLVLLLVIGLTVGNAYSVGLGWGTIEIIYSLAQAIGMGEVMKRDDPASKKAKQILERDMGFALHSNAPWWGILERFSANASHLALSLLLVSSPLFILLTLPFHSFINYILLRIMKYSLARAQIVLIAVGIPAFIISLLLTNAI